MSFLKLVFKLKLKLALTTEIKIWFLVIVQQLLTLLFTGFPLEEKLPSEAEYSNIWSYLRSRHQLLLDPARESNNPSVEETEFATTWNRIQDSPSEAQEEISNGGDLLFLKGTGMNWVFSPILENQSNLEDEIEEKMNKAMKSKTPWTNYHQTKEANWDESPSPVIENTEQPENQHASRLLLKSPELNRKKRNPRCLRSCLKRGYLHPAQCHMLC